MQKRTVATVLILVVSLILFIPNTVFAQGPNYVGYESPKHVTIGDTFYTDVWADISQFINFVGMDNFTFLPAGIINYTSAVSGDLFGGTTMWADPESDGTINNDAGWAKPLVWGHTGGANNTNATAFNITWYANGVGMATITWTEGGTAYNGEDPGTDKSPGYIYVHPESPTGFAVTQISGGLHLEWTKNTGMDNTLVRYRADTNPTSVTDGNLLYNGTASNTDHEGLSPGDHMYYSIWGWNETEGLYSLLYETGDGIAPFAPVVSNEDPTNGSINIDIYYPDVEAYVEDDGGVMDVDIHGYYENGTSAMTYTGYEGFGNMTYNASIFVPMPFDEKITWYVNVTDGEWWTNETFEFTVRSQYVPDPPSSLTATALSSFIINLTWTSEAGADKNLVVGKLGGYPTDRADGTIIYNGTEEQTLHSGLNPEEHWFYRAWGWNETDSVFSATYSQADNTTPVFVNTPPGQPTDESPTNNTDYIDVYDIYLNCTPHDPDLGQTVNVSFYWDNHTLIGTILGVTEGTEASLFIPDYLDPDWVSHDINYGWYAVTNDSYAESTGPTWYFLTCKAWDLNIDKVVNYLDASVFVADYGDVVTPGEVPSDINEDGPVNYLDASLLIGHYGESY